MEGHEHRVHDWQSPEYAAAWVADAVARDPERIEQLQLLAKLIPQSHDAPIRVLDLGAGYGILTGIVLATFPLARVTLFDISQAMLDQAKPRLAAHLDQLDWALGDLTRPEWVRAVSPPYDAVVSAAALHNMADGSVIARIYGQLVPLLAPGGAFLCYDHMSAGGPRMQDQFDEVQPIRRPGSGVAAGHDHAPAGGTSTAPAAATKLRFRGSIAAHLGWLQTAGFAEVDCFWKGFHEAVYGGYLA
jgi:tRNA (cmo5U34)-methyltransferase